MSNATRLNETAPAGIGGHELVGQRLVGQLPPMHLVELWIKCASRVVKYGFTIEYRDLEPPRTGTFDGQTIMLDPDVGFEMQCFILLHLFGHSVQWVAPSLEHKLAGLQRSSDLEQFLRVLQAYEFEAATFGLELMHQVGIHDLDQWYSDFVETDWRYVERYYRTGTIPPWDECIAKGSKVIEPRPIPELKHRKVEVRFAF